MNTTRFVMQFSVIVLMVSVLAAAAGAYSPRNNLLLMKVNAYGEDFYTARAGDQLVVGVSLVNTDREDADRTTIRLTIPELGISREIGPFSGPDAGRRSYRMVVLDIPDEATPGLHVLRISVSSDATREYGSAKVSHREVLIL
ncbi:MAG: hypothetical protein ABH879_06600 [archaeon]